MVLTFITIPFVVIIEHLWLSVLLEAIEETDIPTGLITSNLLNLCLSSAHTRKLLDELILKVSVPEHIQDEVSLTLIASVEANIVFDTDLMQKIKNGLFRGVRHRAIRSAIRVTAEVAVFHVSTDVFDS